MYSGTIQTIKLGIYFMLIFTASNSFSLMATFIYDNEGLTAAGPLNLIFNFGSYIVSSFLAPKCRAPFKIQLIAGGLGIAFNMSTGLIIPLVSNKIFGYLIIALGGAAAGITGGYLWVSQGGYQRQVIKDDQNKGKYSGIFQFLYSLANFFAGFVAAFLLGFFSTEAYFITLTAIALSGVLWGFLVFKDIREIDDEGQKAPSAIETLKRTINFLPRMWPVLLILVIDGLALGIFYTQIQKLIPTQKDQDTQEKDKMAGILTIFIGLGSIIGGYVGGYLCDWLRLLKMGWLTLSYYLLAIVMTYVAMKLDNMVFLCFVGFLWGSCYHCIENWCYVMILKLYDGKLQAFSLNRIVHGLAFVLFMVLVLSTDNSLNLTIVLICFAMVAFPAYWFLTKLDYHKEDSEQLTGKTILTQQSESKGQ